MSGSPLVVLAWLPAVASLLGAAATTTWGVRQEGLATEVLAGRPEAATWVGRLEQEKRAMEQLRAEVAAAAAADLTLTDRASTYIVISVGDRKLELHKKGAVPMSVSAGVGKGVTNIDGERWFFETPVGRFTVTAKEEAPEWNAPDWHYLEVASKGKLKKVDVKRSGSYPLADGGTLVVEGDDVGIKAADGTFTALGVGNIVIGDTLYVPPSGTRQRRYPEILGTHRLKMQDGYAIHGTNMESSVGRASSHGCVRLTNADVAKLHEEVPVGTPVFIF